MPENKKRAQIAGLAMRAEPNVELKCPKIKKRAQIAGLAMRVEPNVELKCPKIKKGRDLAGLATSVDFELQFFACSENIGRVYRFVWKLSLFLSLS